MYTTRTKGWDDSTGELLSLVEQSHAHYTCILQQKHHAKSSEDVIQLIPIRSSKNQPYNVLTIVQMLLSIPIDGSRV
jgi:hypothetical protein